MCTVSWSLIPGITLHSAIKDGLFVAKYVVISGWGVNKLTKAMSNKQIYEEVAQSKRVVTVIDCPVIPANIW